jgi:DNA-binding MarR family transcriptional regulator
MINAFLLSLIGKNNLSTYSTGLIQAKAYRILKQRTNSLLSPYKLNSLEWALLGLLYDNEDGFKSNELAELLGVEAPFITVMIDTLESRKLVKRSISKKDKRIKIITASSKAKDLVPKIEKELKIDMKNLLEGCTLPEVYGYVSVLKNILRNVH